MNKNITKTKIGFTLAEVLLTLGIIGVVAALTIPHLIQVTQDNEFRNRFKKEYSVLNSAYTRAIQDNGGDMKGISMCHQPFLKTMTPYLKIKNICNDWHAYGENAIGDACFSSYTFKLLNGNSFTISYADQAGAVLEDGSTIALGEHCITDCSFQQNQMANLQTTKPNIPAHCASALIDVNGSAPPNQVGRDIYEIFFLSNKIVPVGANNDYYSGTCNRSSTGWGCASSVINGSDY